jgi:GABA permease
MIALGGVIGAGLFVGSGAVINATGPAAVISYLLAGLIIVLVMRMLGEMAAAQPTVGSFAEYSRIALGRFAGFATGWLYWWFWVVVVAIEAVAGAEIVQGWIPGVPLWVFALGLMILLTLTNVLSVRSYGEFEFWFASIKVAAIIAFIIAGFSYLLGLWPDTEASFAPLTAEGGFAPEGLIAILSGIVIVIFAFVGAEIVTIAAAESDEPERAVAKATNAVIWRVLVFYVLAVFVVVSVLPWNDTELGTSPFAAALEQMGVGAAAELMNVVILTAVLSCLNSGLYTASRMLFALGKRGDAPRGLLELSGRGVPVRSILLATSVGYVSVIFAYLSPDKVFQFLVYSSGAIAIFVYMLVAVSELRMRRRLERESPDRLTVRMPWFPYSTYLAIAVLAAAIGSMILIDEMRPNLLASLASVAVVVVAFLLRERAAGRQASPGALVARGEAG